MPEKKTGHEFDSDRTPPSDRDKNPKIEAPAKKKGLMAKLFKADVGDDDNFQNKLKRFFTIYGFICAILLSICGLRDAATVDRIKTERQYQEYSVFMEAVTDKQIYSAYLSSDESKLIYQYIDDVPADLRAEDPSSVGIMKLKIDTWYYTNYASYDELRKTLAENNVPLIRGKFDSTFGTMLSLIISLTTTVGMIYFMWIMVSMIVKNMSINANKYEINKSSDYKFSDVIGHDEVINDIKQYISLLQKNDKLNDIHVKTPKGILFSGRPGTGKTLLAKAMAGEAGVPFIYLNTSNVIEMYVGVGAKTIRACFKKAREMAPCVVFLDEIDAIGGGRGANITKSSEDTQTLLALLQEMDGFSGSDGILIIGATNVPDSLDEALRRSGRFDREIMIQPPRNASVRQQMLEHYTRHYKLGKDVDLSSFAKQLVDMTGADIANICNEAAVMNIMENNGELGTIHMQNLVDAMDKLLLKGNKVDDKKRVNQQDRRIVAYHEAGHAVMNFLLDEPISRISIQGTTSGVGGFVMSADKDSQFRSVTDLEHNILVAYGGRASEIIKFGKDCMTTGAVNDIQQSTNLMTAMYLKYGFDDDLGMLDYEKLIQAGLVDKHVVYERVRATSVTLMEKTMAMLKDSYYLVEALAQKMLEDEVISGEEATAYLKATQAHK